MKNWKKFFGMLGALICALGLNAMEFKSNPNVIAELEYFYAKDGTITGRRVNDRIQMYSYDKRGQLLAVIDGDGKPVEQYVYDPAGNILSKTVNGKTTTFTYDKANQLVSSTVDGKTTDYRYDGAGRLVQEGDKTYQYGYLDKILNVLENGETVAGFDYHMDGQIASSTTKDGTENFLWDGLALIHRGGTNYINEPAVTGGNPILADGNVLFNDMLGTTLGVKSGEGFDSIARDAFGQTTDQSKEQFFTGKPYVGELGYAFLFRNYRANQGKWQTEDPLGYPDGWNNFAYVNNNVMKTVDLYGTECSWSIEIETTRRFESSLSDSNRATISYSEENNCYYIILTWWAVFYESWPDMDIDCWCNCGSCSCTGHHITGDYIVATVHGPPAIATIFTLNGELLSEEEQEAFVDEWTPKLMLGLLDSFREWKNTKRVFEFVCCE